MPDNSYYVNNLQDDIDIFPESALENIAPLQVVVVVSNDGISAP